MNEIFKKLKPFSGLIPAVLIVEATAISLSGYEKPIYKAENNFKTNQSEQETIKNKDSSFSKSNKSKRKNAKEVSNKTSKAEKVTESGEWKDGTYTGSGTGYCGTITVQITIKNHKITDIKVLSSSDDHPYFDNAKSMLEVIKSKQTTNVDTVSGATFSSKGIINEINNALNGGESDEEN